MSINPFDVIIERIYSLECKFDQACIKPEVPNTEIIGRKELCKRLNISEPTAIRWANKGSIPSFTIGSSIRYNWPKVIEALEAKKKRGVK
jgi:excisionase family DNA binding protein